MVPRFLHRVRRVPGAGAAPAAGAQKPPHGGKVGGDEAALIRPSSLDGWGQRA